MLFVRHYIGIYYRTISANRTAFPQGGFWHAPGTLGGIEGGILSSLCLFTVNIYVPVSQNVLENVWCIL